MTWSILGAAERFRSEVEHPWNLTQKYISDLRVISWYSFAESESSHLQNVTSVTPKLSPGDSHFRRPVLYEHFEQKRDIALNQNILLERESPGDSGVDCG